MLIPSLLIATVDEDHFVVSNGELNFSVNQDTNLHVWQGSFLEQHDFTITEAGGTVTGNLEKEGGGDLTMYFSDEFTVLDCTSPQCTVTLTPSAGGGADPVKNRIYILQSDKLLVKTTSDWPAAEHIRVAEVILRTAAETSSDNGALGNRNWNDFAFGITDPRGHGLHIAERLRFEHAAWKEGTALSVIGDGTSFIDLKVTTGKVYQLHLQTFPEADMSAGDDIHVANQPSDPFVTTEDMVGDITVDSSNVAFQNNGHFNLVIWGIQNRTGEASHIVCNLPSGSYGPGASSAGNAINDRSNFDDFAIPTDFRGSGFLIGRLTFLLSGGNWTLVDALDLRGSIPSNVAGSGIGVNITAFSDDDFEVFAVGDVTAKTVFDNSNITTNSTRTITMANADVDLADITLNNIHRADNSQAHSDYLKNDEDDTTTGVLTVEGLGTGGQTDYDLKVGDTDGTPTYGMIQIGNACIGRTSFKAGNIDLDGSIIYRNIAGPVTSEIEHVFVESTGDSTRFALAKAGVGNATYNSRSMLIAGPAPADTDYVKVTYWQTNNNIFDNLACDTSGVGADLGVQNDLEVEGDIFTDSIKESTTGEGITFNTFGINNALHLGSIDPTVSEEVATPDALYHFEGDLTDDGGSSNDLTEQTGPTESFTPRGNRQALLADGTVWFLAANSYVPVQGNAARSVSFMFKMPIGSTGAKFVEWGDTGANNTRFGIWGSNGSILLSYRGTNVLTTDTFDDNQWHHCLVTHQNTGGGTVGEGTLIYVDAVSRAFTGDTGTEMATGSIALTVHSRTGGTTPSPNGTVIDELAIYTSNLSQANATTLFNGLKEKFTLDEFGNATFDGNVIIKGDLTVFGDITAGGSITGASLHADDGDSGSFMDGDDNTITVVDGIITNL